MSTPNLVDYEILRQLKEQNASMREAALQAERKDLVEYYGLNSYAVFEFDQKQELLRKQDEDTRKAVRNTVIAVILGIIGLFVLG